MNANKHENDLKRYIEFWEALKPQTIDHLDSITVDDLYFSDPFRTFDTRASVKRYLRKMYDLVDNPAFRITMNAWALSREPFPKDTDGIAFIKWEYSYSHRGESAIRTIIGLSEIHLSRDGKIMRHIDHWDAAENIYEKIPFLGGLLRLVKKRI